MTSNTPATLYVDDDPASWDVLSILLKRVMGFSEVTYFENSKDFKERVQSLPIAPTLIFLDILVRPYDGYEMLTMLRTELGFSQTPIVALTANVMTTDIIQLKTAGFTGLIGKPIDYRLFPDLVKRILAGEAVWYIS